MGFLNIPFSVDHPMKPGQYTVVVDLAKNTLIKDVIFNFPATIVFWADGTKTVVKCVNECYDPEKGLAMAICKKILGNTGAYNKLFKKWLTKYQPPEPDGSCEAMEYNSDISFDSPEEMEEYFKRLDEFNMRFKEEFANTSIENKFEQIEMPIKEELPDGQE